jgi:hypothetical protein
MIHVREVLGGAVLTAAGWLRTLVTPARAGRAEPS